MPTLTIHNPATGAVIAERSTDDAGSVASKAHAARAAQPAWMATPLRERLAIIERFRSALVAELDTLAATLTSAFLIWSFIETPAREAVKNGIRRHASKQSLQQTASVSVATVGERAR
jgi:acyl-CoA reductase-like NAD-dependent aldehyde dehydrogenase